MTDFEAGKPLEHLHVEYGNYSTENDQFSTSSELRTNHLGLVLLPSNKAIQAVRPIAGADSFASPTLVYPIGNGFGKESTNPAQVSLFTDRGLYRPGDAVYFKGIAYTDDPTDPHKIGRAHA